MMRNSNISLGFTPAAQRSVKPMPQWVLDLVPRPTGKNETVKPKDEDTERDTMPLIKNKIRRTLHHTAKLAPKLKGSTLEESTRNVWKFVFDHVKYVKDDEGKEQVRSPRRTIWEGRGDCDCMIVLISSLLMNMRIIHSLRIFKQESRRDPWGHIYIVVPRNGKLPIANRSQYIVIDCVTHAYNFEAPHVEHKDFSMALEYLDGLNETAQGCKSNSQTLKYFERAQQFRDRGMVITEEFLAENKVPFTVVDGAQYGFMVGKTFVAPIITPQQAATLLLPEIQNPPPSPGDKPTKKSCNLLWWGLGIGAAAAALMLSGSSNEKSSKAA